MPSFSLLHGSHLRPTIVSHRRLVHLRRERSGPPAQRSVRAHKRKMISSSKIVRCRGGVECSAKSSDPDASQEPAANAAVKTTVLRVYYTRRDGQGQVQSFSMNVMFGDMFACECWSLQRGSRMGRSTAKDRPGRLISALLRLCARNRRSLQLPAAYSTLETNLTLFCV